MRRKQRVYTFHPSRGGGWCDHPWDARVADANNFVVGGHNEILGLRLARRVP